MSLWHGFVVFLYEVVMNCFCDRAWWLWWWWWLWRWLRRWRIRPGRWVTSWVRVFFGRGGGGGGSVQWDLILHITSVCEASFCTGSLWDISGCWFCLWLTGCEIPSYLLVLFECVASLLISSPGFNNPHPKRVVLSTLLILCSIL